MENKILYIKIDKNTMVQNKIVYLEDLAKIYSADNRMVQNLKRQIVFHVPEDKKSNYIFSILKLIEFITTIYPEVEVVNLGEKDFILHYEPQKKTVKILQYAKVFVVSFMVFFGAAFTIMTFNYDVSVKEVFDLIYEYVKGTKKDGGSILEISYSIGLPLGIMVFFNHFSKIQLGKDPTPLQVQMRLYEENLDKTLIENSNREGNTIDVN
ncbi:MAG: stage sporulation protein [Lachnospiraceae bacterium]|jgi:stage V sporulation protein AA|nr:stage sporulation protein [Lachnospiraceae bacterium]